MKVLVLTGSTNETSYQSITSFLAQIGVPYQAVALSSLAPNSAGSRLPQVPLSDSATGQGLYQGIILTDSTFAACGSSCLSTADWTTLNTYATQFSVRIASYYTKPAAQWGLLPVGAVASYTAASPLSVTLTSAGAAVFAYLNSANPISVAGDGTSPINAYLATPTAAVNETTTPLLTSGAYTVAVTHTNATGQETLALTMDNGPTLMHSFAFGYGVINWVTKGIFLGSRKVYLNNQTDDLLLGNWIYAPSLHPACEGPNTCPTYFETGPDLQALANWQTNLQSDPLFQSARQTFAVNGVGTTWFPASDPIFAAMKSLNSQFWWMSHTWDHPNLDCYTTTNAGKCIPATLTQSLSELKQDIAVVPTLGVTFDEIGMVTPYNSGLTNKSFLQAAAQVGIKYIVDPELPASPNTGIVSPLVPSVLFVTRLNNDLFYDASSPLTGVYGSWPDEYNAQYGPNGITPTYSQDQTYSQILDNLSQQFLQIDMLTYSPYVIESHIANIATYDGTNSVFTDLMNATITKYEKLFTLPVLCLNLEDIGALLTARTNYNASGVVGVYTPGVSVVLTTTNAASIPVTGLCSQATCGTYGEQIQDSVVMAASSSVTIPLTANVGVSLSTVAVNPASVAGGVSATGTITLSGSAPTGGVSISLASNNATAIVPATVTVAAGSTTAAFTVSTSAVTSSALAILTASYGGVSKTAALTITPAVAVPQTITFNAIASQIAGTAIGLSATASSGLPVTFSSPTANVCILSGGAASFIAPGTCTITASQVGNGSYLTATPVSQSFPVLGLTSACSVSLSPLGQAYPSAGAADTLTVTDESACTWSASSNVAWITFPSGTSGSAGENLSYIVSGNTTAQPRTGTITISGTTAIITQTGVGLRFIPVTPCRVLDTRLPIGPVGGPSLAALTSRNFTIAGVCGVPTTAQAYAINATVVPAGSLHYVTIYPAGNTQPLVSTLNSPAGLVKANAAIIPAGVNGAITAFATDATDLIIDINGYFVLSSDTSALSFYPVTPCRAADSRLAGSLGAPYLSGQQVRDFKLRGQCGIPSTAQAYSLNFTAVPRTGKLNYLSVWPSGVPQPLVATLNDPQGQVVANAAIVRAGAGGSISAFVTQDADLIIDVNGYFAPPQGSSGLSFYNLTPCRAFDSHLVNGGATLNGITVVNPNSCPVPLSQVRAYVFNATVVPSSTYHYLTLWQDGTVQPLVSTLNGGGSVTNNMAIVPSVNGLVDAFTTDPTALILDVFGYFAP